MLNKNLFSKNSKEKIVPARNQGKEKDRSYASTKKYLIEKISWGMVRIGIKRDYES